VLAFDALLFDSCCAFWKELRRFSYVKYSSATSVMAILNASCGLCSISYVSEGIRVQLCRRSSCFGTGCSNSTASRKESWYAQGRDIPWDRGLTA
jgi:hypothetical protein